jgi:hypothetical protein
MAAYSTADIPLATTMRMVCAASAPITPQELASCKNFSRCFMGPFAAIYAVAADHAVTFLPADTPRRGLR